jgi:hypothetical protein
VTAPALAPLVEVLDQLEARRLIGAARNALALADDLLARLYAGRAWEALGHADWPTLCAAELPELRHLKMRSVGSTHNDVATITAAATVGDGLEATVPTVAAHVRVAELVAAAGAAGLTIPQAQRRTGWTYGATSGALSRAERRGLVERPVDLEQRGGFRPYRATVTA